MKTTLNQIRSQSPCAEGWKKLLAHLGKTQADDEPLSIITVIDSNGLDDALWCLQAVTGHDREIRLYAIWCARQVQHLMKDPRSIATLEVAERFAYGQASHADLAAAWTAAWAAAQAAAWGAARTAAEAAAQAAAEGAAWTAAQAAAEGAAWTAAWAAAEAAAEGAPQAAAEAAAQAAQKNELRRMCAAIEPIEPDSGTACRRYHLKPA